MLMVVIADDWSEFTGNIPKLGLAILSVIYNLIFIVQHYCIYPKRTYRKLSEDEEAFSVNGSGYDLPHRESNDDTADHRT